MRAELAKHVLAVLVLLAVQERSLEFWRKMVVSVRQTELLSNKSRLRSLKVSRPRRPDVESLNLRYIIAIHSYVCEGGN